MQQDAKHVEFIENAVTHSQSYELQCDYCGFAIVYRDVYFYSTLSSRWITLRYHEKCFSEQKRFIKCQGYAHAPNKRCYNECTIMTKSAKKISIDN